MKKQIFLGILFLLTILIAEHAIFLPFVVLCYWLAMPSSLKQGQENQNRALEAFKKCWGLFAALAVYFICFISSPTHVNFAGNGLFLDRILFISPQVFVHTVRLILFPKIMSIDQTALVHFAPNLLSWYSAFCLIVGLWTIIIWISSFWNDKGVFVLLSGFLISLAPFLQLITCTYCLMSERYLYMPIFFLVLGVGHLMKERDV